MGDHAGLKNATAVSVLGGYVERGELEPSVQQYFPLADVARAFNVSAAGSVVGKLSIVVKSAVGGSGGGNTERDR